MVMLRTLHLMRDPEASGSDFVLWCWCGGEL